MPQIAPMDWMLILSGVSMALLVTCIKIYFFK